MNIQAIKKLDLGKLNRKMRNYENKWIAISIQNTIVSSGNTYKEAVDQIKGGQDVILLKVPPLDASLTP